MWGDAYGFEYTLGRTLDGTIQYDDYFKYIEAILNERIIEKIFEESTAEEECELKNTKPIAQLLG